MPPNAKERRRVADRATSVFRRGHFYPTHCVVEVVHGAEQAARAVAELRATGFTEEDVTHATGAEAIANDRASMDGRNLRQRAQGLFPSEEANAVEEYLAEAERGHDFVVVRARARERRDRARQILKAHGGHAMRSSGGNTIADLG